MLITAVVVLAVVLLFASGKGLEYMLIILAVILALLLFGEGLTQ